MSFSAYVWASCDSLQLCRCCLMSPLCRRLVVTLLALQGMFRRTAYLALLQTTPVGGLSCALCVRACVQERLRRPCVRPIAKKQYLHSRHRIYTAALQTPTQRDQPSP
eukprot:5341796-Amphidinium_carterae.2